MPIMQINIYEAKTRLSELVDLAHNGESVIIAKAGTPMARLVPLSDVPKRKIKFGTLKGEFIESADFDAPLPEEMLDLFDGKGDAKADAEVKGAVKAAVRPKGKR